MLTGYIQVIPGYWFKKGRLTGRIALKNGYWYMVFNFVTEDGTSRPKWETTKLPERNNKTRANQMLKDQLYIYNTKDAPISGMLMPELLRSWLDVKKSEIESNSYVAYRDIVNLHVIPYFEKLGKPIQQLTGNDIHLYYTTKRKEGLTVLEKHRTVIRGALGYAIVPLGILQVNPTDGVKLPERKGRKTETQMYYSVEEIHALFEAINGESIEAPVRLAATCGLSRSEVLGLRWDAVSFEHNTITVHRATVRVESETEHKDRLKEKARFRTMPMPKSLRNFLEGLYQHQ